MTATSTRHVAPEHRNWGEFKVPSLRNLGLTAPYFHDGGAATLRDVLRHYSELNEERLHADGEKLLVPLKLTEAETDDLLAFLDTLNEGPAR
jgi:cytochrome c peroxidase